MLIVFRALSRVALAALTAACLLTTSVPAQSEAANRRAEIDALYPIMLGALQARNYGRARNICEQAILWEPQNPVHHYNLACIDAQAGGSRLTYAWGSLDLAIALGFNDAAHLQADPDLVPLRTDPRFAQLVRKIMYNQSAQAAIDAIKFPASRQASSGSGLVTNENEESASAGILNGIPQGLFLMTRYLPTTLTLERSVWYFAQDRHVLRDLEHGFSKADLKAHAGPRGKLRQSSEGLEIEWNDGTKTSGELEHDGDGFTWDMRIFEPVESFANPADVAGIYEGSQPVDLSRNELPIAQRLDLGADGGFRWEGVTIVRESGTTCRQPAENAVTTGRWSLNGFSLILTTAEGFELRRIAFPQDDEVTIIRPDHMYFGGMLYKRRP